MDMTGGTPMPGPGRRSGRGEAKARTALAPVRAHLLREARTEADRLIAAAHAEADELVRQARGGAERAVGLAAAQGRAEAAPLAAAERSRGRARARSIVLRAQREAYDELCRRTSLDVGALRDGPGYGLLLTRLSALAAQAAGRDATIAFPPAGGVLARSGQVTVDCSLPRLARQAVHALGDQVRELWEP
jgi:vacuolar-type H+-ATPase subunit H